MNRIVKISAGTSVVLKFTTTYSDEWSVEADGGEPIEADDIDSARFLLKKRLSAPDADAEITKTDADEITFEDGIVNVQLDPADTKDLEGKYFATLRLYMVGGGVHDFEDSTYPNVPYLTVEITQGAVESVS